MNYSAQNCIRLGSLDVDYLVHRCNEHINSEFREFLLGVGCSAATIAQAGY